jgi:hypothetical protein
METRCIIDREKMAFSATAAGSMKLSTLSAAAQDKAVEKD